MQLTTEAEGDIPSRLRQRGAGGPDGAAAQIDSLYEAAEALANFPFRGPVPPELYQLCMADWRQVSVGPNRMIYAVEGEVVTIAVTIDRPLYFLIQVSCSAGELRWRGAIHQRAGADGLLWFSKRRSARWARLSEEHEAQVRAFQDALISGERARRNSVRARMHRKHIANKLYQLSFPDDSNSAMKTKRQFLTT